jgi:hypothetical protein
LASLHSQLEKTTVESVDLGHLLDSRLEAAIEELRDKSETEIAQYKLEVEATYKDKIAILEGQSKKDVAAISRINTELHRMMSSLGDSSSEISRLQKSNEKMASLLRSKEEELVSARQSHTEEVSKLVAELRGLRESYETKIREYEELMDIRIQLDQEIATYQALLHEEETRLHITVTPPREKRRSLRVPMSEPVPKRPRLHQQQQQQEEQSFTTTSSAGFIQICDVDPSGKFVRIKNMSLQIESLGKFKIQHEVEGSSEVVFRFHAKSKLQGGHSVTVSSWLGPISVHSLSSFSLTLYVIVSVLCSPVWQVWGSKAEGAVHSPPDNIIWKAVENWGCGAPGEKTVTKLVAPSGDVVATFSQRSEVKITPVKSKQQVSGSPSSLADAGSLSYPSLPESG